MMTSKERIMQALRKEKPDCLFEDFGKDGGYIMAACDHFFDTPVENLIVFANAAKE